MTNQELAVKNIKDHCDFRGLICTDYEDAASHAKSIKKCIPTTPSKTLFPPPHYVTINKNTLPFSNTAYNSRSHTPAFSSKYNINRKKRFHQVVHMDNINTENQNFLKGNDLTSEFESKLLSNDRSNMFPKVKLDSVSVINHD